MISPEIGNNLKTPVPDEDVKSNFSDIGKIDITLLFVPNPYQNNVTTLFLVFEESGSFHGFSLKECTPARINLCFTPTPERKCNPVSASVSNFLFHSKDEEERHKSMNPLL